MASNDIALDNLKGFIKKGARANNRGFVPSGHFNLDFSIKYGTPPNNVDLNSLEDYDPKIPLGLPLGRIVELFGAEASGKSSLAYRVCGFGQKMGLPAAWIDTEHSFEEELAELNGLSVDDLWYSSLYDEDDPDKNFFAEDIMDNIVMLCKSGARIVILDSVANLIPKDVDEKTAEHQHIAKIARLMSQQLGKIAHYAAKNNVLVVFINQLREKPGIMFGCFHYNSRVVLADGSTEKIGKIVNQQLPVEVLSCDINTGEIRPKKITAWHDNGNLNEDESFLQFVVRKKGGNGRSNFACTSNHILFRVIDGEIRDFDQTLIKETRAADLDPGDFILSSQPFYLTRDQKQIAYGSVLGDGSIRRSSSADSCAHLRLGHGIAQKEYCQWKQEILEPWICCVCENEKKYAFDTIPMFELCSLIFRDNDKVEIPGEVIENLSDLGLAVWYLDDGTFSLRDYKNKKEVGRSLIACTKFSNRAGMLSVLGSRFNLHPSLIRNGFAFNQEDTKRLHEIIARYVPPSMEYKLLPSLRGRYDYEINDVSDEQKVLKPIASEILDIYEKPPTRTKKKFDITVEDFGTYIVDGVVVHNSPETTPGGRALKFNSSVRIKMTKRSSTDSIIFVDDSNEPDGKRIIGRYSGVVLEKNRMGPPLLDGKGKSIVLDVPVYYKPYFPDLAERLFDSGRQLKLISMRKNVFTWKDIKIEGRQGFIEHLKSNALEGALLDELHRASEENSVALPPEITMAILEAREKKENKDAEAKSSTRERKSKSSRTRAADSAD